MPAMTELPMQNKNNTKKLDGDELAEQLRILTNKQRLEDNLEKNTAKESVAVNFVEILENTKSQEIVDTALNNATIEFKQSLIDEELIPASREMVEDSKTQIRENGFKIGYPKLQANTNQQINLNQSNIQPVFESKENFETRETTPQFANEAFSTITGQLAEITLPKNLDALLECKTPADYKNFRKKQNHELSSKMVTSFVELKNIKNLKSNPEVFPNIVKNFGSLAGGAATMAAEFLGKKRNQLNGGIVGSTADNLGGNLRSEIDKYKTDTGVTNNLLNLVAKKLGKKVADNHPSQSFDQHKNSTLNFLSEMEVYKTRELHAQLKQKEGFGNVKNTATNIKNFFKKPEQTEGETESNIISPEHYKALELLVQAEIAKIRQDYLDKIEAQTYFAEKGIIENSISEIIADTQMETAAYTGVNMAMSASFLAANVFTGGAAAAITPIAALAMRNWAAQGKSEIQALIDIFNDEVKFYTGQLLGENEQGGTLNNLKNELESIKNGESVGSQNQLQAVEDKLIYLKNFNNRDNKFLGEEVSELANECIELVREIKNNRQYTDAENQNLNIFGSEIDDGHDSLQSIIRTCTDVNSPNEAISSAAKLEKDKLQQKAKDKANNSLVGGPDGFQIPGTDKHIKITKFQMRMLVLAFGTATTAFSYIVKMQSAGFDNPIDYMLANAGKIKEQTTDALETISEIPATVAREMAEIIESAQETMQQTIDNGIYKFWEMTRDMDYQYFDGYLSEFFANAGVGVMRIPEATFTKLDLSGFDIDNAVMTTSHLSSQARETLMEKGMTAVKIDNATTIWLDKSDVVKLPPDLNSRLGSFLPDYIAKLDITDQPVEIVNGHTFLITPDSVAENSLNINGNEIGKGSSGEVLNITMRLENGDLLQKAVVVNGVSEDGRLITSELTKGVDENTLTNARQVWSADTRPTLRNDMSAVGGTIYKSANDTHRFIQPLGGDALLAKAQENAGGANASTSKKAIELAKLIVKGYENDKVTEPKVRNLDAVIGKTNEILSDKVMNTGSRGLEISDEQAHGMLQALFRTSKEKDYNEFLKKFATGEMERLDSQQAQALLDYYNQQFGTKLFNQQNVQTIAKSGRAIAQIGNNPNLNWLNRFGVTDFIDDHLKGLIMLASAGSAVASHEVRKRALREAKKIQEEMLTNKALPKEERLALLHKLESWETFARVASVATASLGISGGLSIGFMAFAVAGVEGVRLGAGAVASGYQRNRFEANQDQDLVDAQGMPIITDVRGGVPYNLFGWNWLTPIPAEFQNNLADLLTSPEDMLYLQNHIDPDATLVEQTTRFKYYTTAQEALDKDREANTQIRDEERKDYVAILNLLRDTHLTPQLIEQAIMLGDGSTTIREAIMIHELAVDQVTDQWQVVPNTDTNSVDLIAFYQNLLTNSDLINDGVNYDGQIRPVGSNYRVAMVMNGAMRYYSLPPLTTLRQVLEYLQKLPPLTIPQATPRPNTRNNQPQAQNRQPAQTNATQNSQTDAGNGNPNTQSNADDGAPDATAARGLLFEKPAHRESLERLKAKNTTEKLHQNNQSENKNTLEFTKLKLHARKFANTQRALQSDFVIENSEFKNSLNREQLALFTNLSAGELEILTNEIQRYIDDRETVDLFFKEENVKAKFNRTLQRNGLKFRLNDDNYFSQNINNQDVAVVHINNNQMKSMFGSDETVDGSFQQLDYDGGSLDVKKRKLNVVFINDDTVTTKNDDKYTGKLYNTRTKNIGEFSNVELQADIIQDTIGHEISHKNFAVAKNQVEQNKTLNLSPETIQDEFYKSVADEVLAHLQEIIFDDPKITIETQIIGEYTAQHFIKNTIFKGKNENEKQNIAQEIQKLNLESSFDNQVINSLKIVQKFLRENNYKITDNETRELLSNHLAGKPLTQWAELLNVQKQANLKKYNNILPIALKKNSLNHP